MKHMKTTYGDYILEYNQSLTEQELMEMANVSSKNTGVENTVLWFGPNPDSHGYKIKVSNIPNKFDGRDCFTITIPSYNIIGKRDESVITNRILEKIINFIELNIEIIKQYSDYEIETLDFLNSIKKI